MFRILVVEDDESTRLLMCEVLRQAGYEPCPARDGVEALEVMDHFSATWPSWTLPCPGWMASPSPRPCGRATVTCRCSW